MFGTIPNHEKLVETVFFRGNWWNWWNPHSSDGHILISRLSNCSCHPRHHSKIVERLGRPRIGHFPVICSTNLWAIWPHGSWPRKARGAWTVTPLDPIGPHHYGDFQFAFFVFLGKKCPEIPKRLKNGFRWHGHKMSQMNLPISCCEWPLIVPWSSSKLPWSFAPILKQNQQINKHMLSLCHPPLSLDRQ